jgi:5-methylcytosine-specific restriction endonuclease McrA
MYKCKNCKKEVKESKQKTNQFCSSLCFGEYKFINETLPRFKLGEIKERPTLKKCLLYLGLDYKCGICGLREWNNKEISLQLDHINGDSSNNNIDNLRFICPNCHSQTPHYAGKNRGNGRKNKGMPLS